MQKAIGLQGAGDTIEHEQIAFAPSEPLTLGVEVEVQLVDPETLGLAPRAPEILALCEGNPRIVPEFFLSTVEVKTEVCRSAHDAGQTLKPDLAMLIGRASSLGLGLCSTGCHPTARYTDGQITDTERYRELIDRHQWLTRRMTVYGLHFHLGMPSGEACIKLQNSMLPYLPHLLALSASSPYWQGQDTGLASCRPSTYDSLPTAGIPYPVQDWAEFEALVAVLQRAEAIQSLKDLWWDIRPSPALGTLELRCCDGPATLAEALALTAFTHLLALKLDAEIEDVAHVPAPPRWMLRENKWRAVRHGLDAKIVVDAHGNTQPMRDEIERLLAEMAIDITRLGYEPYIETLRGILAHGNSSTRQRAVFARRNSFDDVIRFNVEELCTGKPIWPAAAA